MEFKRCQDKGDFQLLIDKLEDSFDTLPRVLPIGHLTKLEYLDNIVKEKALTPRECKVFSKELLYFSYGGVFHRTESKSTQKGDELPVAFLFETQVLKKIQYYYPYDTGAAAKGIYEKHWSSDQNSIYCVKPKGDDDFYICSKFVKYIYKNNKEYFRGKVSSKIPSNLKDSPVFSNLYKFLKKNLTSDNVDRQKSTNDVDHRKNIIECQTQEKISIFEDIVWVCIPPTNKGQNYWKAFAEHYKKIGKPLPKNPGGLYDYPSISVSFKPTDLQAIIQDKAHDFIKNNYAW